eukprot:SAG31_NODE_273_length_18667_cov_3.603619_4_plen_118_part_00
MNDPKLAISVCVALLAALEVATATYPRAVALQRDARLPSRCDLHCHPGPDRNDLRQASSRYLIPGVQNQLDKRTFHSWSWSWLGCSRNDMAAAPNARQRRAEAPPVTGHETVLCGGS